MDRVLQHLPKGLRSRDVVGKAAYWEHLAVLRVLALVPLSKQVHDDVALEPLEEDLGEEVEVADEGSLQDDGHVARVEEIDGVLLLARAAVQAAGLQFDLEVLEVDNDDEHQEGREQVDDVGELGAIERLLHCAHLVAAGDDEVEEGNNGALKLRPRARC